MGGEKIIWASVSIAALGLPPRRRGKVVGHSGVLLDVGITPAWAGKGVQKLCILSIDQDHPRVGGEKLRMGFLRGLVLGSPPRGRGKGDDRCTGHL